MNYTIFRKPDLYYESICILSDIYNDSFRARKNLVLERCGGMISERDVDLLFADNIALCYAVRREVEINDNLAAMLLKKREGISPPLAFTFWFYKSYPKEQYSEMHRRALSIIANAAVTDSFPPPANIEVGFIDWIEQNVSDTSDKYDFLRLFYLFDSLLEQFNHVIAKVSRIISDELPHFQQEIDAFIDMIEGEIAINGIDFLKRWADVSLDLSDEYLIYPSFDMGLVLFDDHSGSNRQRLLLGIRTIKLLEMENEYRFKGSKLSDFFKTLSDSTKMSILMLLKQEVMYSGQLAERLNLSGPTISHHMNTLTQLQLVSLEKKGNRVFYTINTKVFDAYIDEINKAFRDR